MSRKVVLPLLVAAVLLGSAGCGKQGGTAGAKKQTKAPAQGKSGTAESPPPTTVGGQKPGATAQQPPAGRAQPPAAGGTEANQPGARAPAQPGQTTPAAADITAMKQTYLQASDQTLNSLQQKMSTLQSQISTLKPELQEKAQQLQKQFQQDLTNARAALDKVKTAGANDWQAAKANADKALNSAATTLKDLQAYLGSPQGTK
jgi:hypothetical protein